MHSLKLFAIIALSFIKNTQAAAPKILELTLEEDTAFTTIVTLNAGSKFNVIDGTAGDYEVQFYRGNCDDERVEVIPQAPESFLVTAGITSDDGKRIWSYGSTTGKAYKCDLKFVMVDGGQKE